MQPVEVDGVVNADDRSSLTERGGVAEADPAAGAGGGPAAPAGSGGGGGGGSGAAKEKPPLWVAICVLVNLLFGLLPVFSRFLIGPPHFRLQAEGSRPSWAVAPAAALTLTAVGQAGAALIVLLNGALEVLRARWCARATAASGSAGARGAVARRGAPSPPRGAAGGGGGGAAAAAGPCGVRHHPQLAARYGLITCARAATNVMSAQ